MSHVRPHADVYTLVVENKLIRAVSWEKVCRPLSHISFQIVV